MANSFPGSGLAYADCFSVGTASPSQIFEVKSPSNDGGLKKYVFKGYDSTGNQNGIALRVFDTQTAVGFADVGADYYGSGGSTTLTFSTRNGGGALTEGMRLTNLGRVGIGTTEPSINLQVQGTCNCAVSNGTFWNFTFAGAEVTNLSNCPSSVAGLALIGGAGRGSVSAIANLLETTGAGSLGFFTGGGATSTVPERMRITSAGKVGVGSTSPNGQLTVSVDQSVNNQHFNIVGTQTSFCQEYSFGIPTSTKDLRIYDGTAGAVRLTLTCLGNLGLNTTTPGTYKLNVNGAFYAAGSSKEYKTSICEYNTDSCMFMKLKPVTYDYKEEWKHLGKQLKSGTQIGLIAEDTAEVFPELAVLKEEENEQVVRNVDYEKLSIVLLAEVQKLRKEVDDLKTK